MTTTEYQQQNHSLPNQVPCRQESLSEILLSIPFIQEQEQHRTTIAYIELCSPFIYAPEALSYKRPVANRTKWP
jgi:hypothetical protein